MLPNMLTRKCHTAEQRSEANASPRVYFAASVVLLFVFTLCFGLFWAGTQEQPLSGRLIYSEEDGACTPVLLERCGDDVIFAGSGEESAVLLRLNGDTGEILVRTELDFPLYWASLCGDTLFVRNDAAENAALAAYDVQSLEAQSQRQLNFKPNDVVFFECDEQGNCFYVLSGSRRILRTALADGTENTCEFADLIEFLEVDDSGAMWVYCGRRLMTAQLGQEFTEVEFAGVPYCLLDGGRLMDTDGVVYRIDRTAVPVFKCAETIYNRMSLCVDAEGGLIVAKSGGGVSRYTEKGAAGGSCKLEKTAAAVCGTGAIYRVNDGVYYSAFNFGMPMASPSPQPTVTPGPNYPPAYAEGDYIVMSDGTTADELRELFMPEAVVIRDKNGNQVYHGRISTGMTAGDWTLVIRGDCNGTGTINTADLRQAMYFVIYSYHYEMDDDPTDVYHRAADMNDNGMVDLDDLTLLADMIRNK